jgi:ABC-type Fe3+ transport system substrate-binding protein
MTNEDRIGRRRAMSVAGAMAATAAWPARAQAPQPDAAMLRAAEQEGEVIWYTTYIVNLAVRPLAAAFEKKYPKIKLRYVPAPPAEGVTRLLNENRAGSVQADVFDSGTVFVPTHAAGMVASYKPRAAENFRAEYKDPDGYWTAANLQVATASVNTDLVRAQDVPKTYDDLLLPRWQGRMAWSDNHSSTGATGFIGNILLTRGPDKGMEYLRALAKQRISTMAAVQRVVLDQNIAGQYPLVLSIYNYHAQISMAEGAPIRWLKMEPVVSSFGTISLLKGARHPNAAKLFIEFFLSEEGQAVLRDANYLPIHPNVPPKVADLMPEAGGFQTTIISPMLYAQHEQEWLKLFREMFI